MMKSLFSERVFGQNKRKSMYMFRFNVRHTLNADSDKYGPYRCHGGTRPKIRYAVPRVRMEYLKVL